MKKIRIGIVGLFRGMSFVSTYKNADGVELKAVCEINSKTIDAVRDKLPESTLIFNDFMQFIDCGLDAVVLANTFNEHAKFAVIALGKGIHVLSETTAAPTLGECVKLCEAVENSGCKYMLAANVPHMFGCLELDRIYKGGTFGRVLYAEGEYLHPTDPNVDSGLSPGEYHWRRWLPRTYYNMHDLGTLMSITGTLPKRVNAKAVFAPDVVSKTVNKKNTGDVVSIILNEMNNGAIFRTTACGSLGPAGKWFRLACENGTIETLRGDQDSVKYTYNPWAIPADGEMSRSYDARPQIISEAQQASGHGGSDYSLNMMFLKYLNGEVSPFFNVYNSAALSAAGILAWRSVLDNGNGYDIPDFTDKAARMSAANDFLTPFPNPDGSGVTITCSSQPYTK